MEITTADHPFERCSLDIVCVLSETAKGKKCILTFQDINKVITAILMTQRDAETIAREFVMNVIFEIGTPKQLLTDQGAKLLSDLLKNSCQLLRIKKLQTTVFKPESNEGLERSHRVLAQCL
jgi:hypothetical protein